MTTQPKPFYIICADLALHAHAVENAAAKLEQVKQEANEARNQQVRDAERLNAIAHKEAKGLTNDLDFNLQVMGGSADELRPIDARAAREFQQVSQAVQVPSAGVNELPLERESVSQLQQAISYAFDSFREAMMTYKAAVRFYHVRRQGLRFGAVLAALIAVTAGISLYSQARQNEYVAGITANTELVYSVAGKIFRYGTDVPLFDGARMDCQELVVSQKSGKYFCENSGFAGIRSLDTRTMKTEVVHPNRYRIIEISRNGNSVAYLENNPGDSAWVKFSIPDAMSMSSSLIDVNTLAISPDGTQYTYFFRGNREWMLNNNRKELYWLDSDFYMSTRRGITWANTTNLLALYSLTTVAIGDFNGAKYYQHKLSLDSGILGIAWSPDDRYIAIVTRQSLYAMEYNTGRISLLMKLEGKQFDNALGWGSLTDSK